MNANASRSSTHANLMRASCPDDTGAISPRISWKLRTSRSSVGDAKARRRHRGHIEHHHRVVHAVDLLHQIGARTMGVAQGAPKILAKNQLAIARLLREEIHQRRQVVVPVVREGELPVDQPRAIALEQHVVRIEIIVTRHELRLGAGIHLGDRPIAGDQSREDPGRQGSVRFEVAEDGAHRVEEIHERREERSLVQHANRTREGRESRAARILARVHARVHERHDRHRVRRVRVEHPRRHRRIGMRFACTRTGARDRAVRRGSPRCATSIRYQKRSRDTRVRPMRRHSCATAAVTGAEPNAPASARSTAARLSAGIRTSSGDVALAFWRSLTSACDRRAA